MRFRAVAASAALALCALTGATACSSSGAAGDPRPAAPASSEPERVDDVTGRIETGERRAGGPETGEPGAQGQAECVTSAARLPSECEVSDLSFVEVEEGEPAQGPPAVR